MVEKIPYYRLRDFSEKLTATFSFLRQNFKPLGKAILFVCGPIILVMAAIQLYIGNALAYEIGLEFEGITGRVKSYYATGYLMGALLISLAQLSVVCVTYGYMLCYQEKGPNQVTLKDTWNRALNLFGPILGTYLVLFLASIAVGTISIILLMIPFFIFMVFWSIVPAMVAFEKVSPFTALSRSVQVMGEKWFSTIGLLIVLSIIVYSFSMFATLPVLLIQLFGGSFATEAQFGDSTSEALLMASILATVASTVLMFLIVIPYVGLAFQLFNLVERKEHRGFMMEIAQLGEQAIDDDEDTF